MQPSIFDPSIFLDATTTEEAKARIPLPPSDYLAVIADITPKQGEKDGKPWYSLVLKLAIEVPGEVRAALGMSEAPFELQDSVFLDITPQGGLDWAPGKNGRLRTYREATGMNVPGVAFNPRMLMGKLVRLNIQHRIYNDRPIEDIKGVTAA